MIESNMALSVERRRLGRTGRFNYGVRSAASGTASSRAWLSGHRGLLKRSSAPRLLRWTTLWTSRSGGRSAPANAAFAGRLP